MSYEVGKAPSHPAGLEIFDELVHGPDERVGALKDLLDCVERRVSSSAAFRRSSVTMTLCSSAFSSSRSYLSPAASLTSCTRSSTTAASHAERSGSVPPRRKVIPVSPTMSASFAASVRSCGPLPQSGSVDDPSAPSESEILDNQETD